MSRRRLAMLTMLLLSTVTSTAPFIISSGKDLTESTTSISPVLTSTQTVLTGNPNSTDAAFYGNTESPVTTTLVFLWLFIAFVVVLVGLFLGFIYTLCYMAISLNNEMRRHEGETYEIL